MGSESGADLRGGVERIGTDGGPGPVDLRVYN